MIHVYTSNHKSNIAFRDKTITGFHNQLTKIDQPSGAKWVSLLHTAIGNLGGRFNIIHKTAIIPPSLLDAQHTIGWFYLLQGIIHNDLWEHLRHSQVTAMGVIAIKALWKLASIIWRRRNRKKYGKSYKEKRYIQKTALDEEFTILRDTLFQLEIPHTPVPIGYRHRVDAKLAWLRWDKSSMLLWKKGKLESYIVFHSTHKDTHNSHPSQKNSNRESEQHEHQPPADPPD
jgi:hypothetical protein